MNPTLLLLFFKQAWNYAKWKLKTRPVCLFKDRIEIAIADQVA